MEENENWTFKKELSEFDSNFIEPSWNLTKIDCFKSYLTYIFDDFPCKVKLNFKFVKYENQLESGLNISLKTDIGIISTIIGCDKINSPECPQNLPIILRNQFEKQYFYRKEKMRKKLI